MSNETLTLFKNKVEKTEGKDQIGDQIPDIRVITSNQVEQHMSKPF